MNHIVKRVHRMMLNGHLVIIELNGHQMGFSVFQQNEENVVWKTRLMEDEFYSLIEEDDEDGISLFDLFELIKRRGSECIEQLRNCLKLRIKVSNKNK